MIRQDQGEILRRSSLNLDRSLVSKECITCIQYIVSVIRQELTMNRAQRTLRPPGSLVESILARFVLLDVTGKGNRSWRPFLIEGRVGMSTRLLFERDESVIMVSFSFDFLFSDGVPTTVIPVLEGGFNSDEVLR